MASRQSKIVASYEQFICICCHASGELIHTELTDQLFSAPGLWNTRQCTNAACRLAWLDPQPERQEIAKLYETYWTHGDSLGSIPAPDAQISEGWKRHVRSVLSLLLPWRRHALRSDGRYLADVAPGRLVDVGCGMGEFAAGMALRGWVVDGIDFDEGALAIARQQPNITARVGALADQDYSSETFDAITMSNVIEHIPDPVETFAEAYRVLRPRGRLIMITPNIQSLGHAVFGADWRGLEPPRHLYLYTASALKRMATAAGFSTVRAFSTPGAAMAMFESSNDMAVKNGRPKRDGLRGLLQRERLGTSVGRLCGEWVILWAEK
jgi:2-polyprenyl-3-methyl-5-hydroxy-6-metoxy-1,4-benzoquinol methylase